MAVAVAILGAIFSSGFTPLSAQRYPIRVYTEADGLSSSSVYDIAEAPDGRLWFATRGGVCVYDGSHWRRFDFEDGLPPSSFVGVAIDEDGTVWALNNRSPQLFRWQGEGWSGLPPFDRAWFDREWAGADLVGLELVAPDAGGVQRRPVVGTSHGLFIWGGETWESLRSDPVLALSSRDGVLFVSTDAGFFRLPAADAEFEKIDLAGSEVRGLASMADDSGLWLAGAQSLGRWSEGRYEPWVENLPRLGRSSDEIQVEPDAHGGVFLGGSLTLVHVSDELEVTALNESNGFAGAGATAFLRSSDGVLWVGGERGVSKLMSRRFVSYDKTSGLFANEVSAIIEARPGVLIFGHNGGLTEVIDGRPERTLALAEPEDWDGARVMDLVKKDGDIWAVVSNRSLWVLPGGDIAAARRIADPKGALPKSLAGLTVDAEGRFWLGGVGLVRFAEGQFESVEQPAGAVGIRRLATGEDGRVYAATVRRGLWMWSGDQWSAATQANGMAPSLYTIAFWRSKLWVGADEGLFSLEDGRLVKATEPLVERPVYALMPGQDGRLWIGTDTGIIHFDGASSRWLGMRDGLAGNETNRAGLITDHEGHVWIGTVFGASRYDARYDEIPGPPVPRIDVLAAGNTYALDGPLSLPWHGNQMTFRFRSTSFLDEERIEYSGRLVGFDEEFQPPSRAVGRRMHYTNLPPGDYHFEVRARYRMALGKADWSEIVASPPIRIARPWWATPGFYGLLAMVSLLIVGGAFRQVAARRHRQQLETLVGERAQELVAANQKLKGEIEEHRRTEQRLRQATVAAEEASLAKSRFLAVMSHEIRTPMTGVLGLVDLLERDSVDEQQVGRVRTLRRAGEALLAILDDILDYSRLESGRLELRQESFSLHRVLEDVVALFRPEADEKGLELRLLVDDAVPPRLRGDISRVRQVMVNLVGNAVKFTERGEVEVEGCWQEEEMTLIVRDSGIGIAASDQANLFDPFQQVDSSPVRSYGGTGLGLAICRRLVEAMEGEIHLSSQVGQGSTFSLRLPAERCQESLVEVASEIPEGAVDAPESGRRLPASESGDLRILVAEDNPMVQRLTLEMLDTLGYQADLATNGAEVLENLEERAYDLLLMDVQMPVLDGLETSRRICARWPHRRPHIIAVTAHALRGDRETCLEAGMDDYLSKPISLEVLDQKISAFSDQR